MIARSIFSIALVITTVHSTRYGMDSWREDPSAARCLTGYMTDLQSWVDKDGKLTIPPDATGSIDISAQSDVIGTLQREMSRFRCTKSRRVRYMSFAKCNLTHVPPVFQSQDNFGRQLVETAEYITFYGNNFGMVTADSDHYDVIMNASYARELTADDEFQRLKLSSWAVGLQDVTFSELKELDLRSCSISVVGDLTFYGMPKLEYLYMSENNIYYINANALNGLRKLQHLDLSRNHHIDENGIFKRLIFETIDIFNDLKLKSLDLSYTMMSERNIPSIRRIGSSLERLSLCYSGLGKLPNDIFNGTSLRYLDISGNAEAINAVNVFRGIENSLQVIYADDIALKSLHFFRNLPKLEILKLSHNEIAITETDYVKNLKQLQILDLDSNRLKSWVKKGALNFLPKLKMLLISNNNINLISDEVIQDIKHLSYISFSGNFIVCNCNARELYDVGLKNEFQLRDRYITPINNSTYDSISYHTGFDDYNERIRLRNNVSEFCAHHASCSVEQTETDGSYLLLDYDTSYFKCLSPNNNMPKHFYQVQTCSQLVRDMNLDEFIERGWNRTYILIVPFVLLPAMLFLFTFRKNLKYFIITVRNSATLSLISKSDACDDDTIFNYDVFVSYCNEDRPWVLDHLLPHVEKDCNISVCLHERDFQVGLSILENIVSCMDRSRMIMLVISQPFLLSQWCQFEMHLAQHRLLETRRENLILILLEDIPRSLRPNTLHYLMLTKTYIVWPKEESDHALFWRRMKKSLITHKLKETENVSLA